MSVSISYYVEEGDEEVEYIIEGDVEPYTPARLHGHPDSWAPAEGGCVVDIEVWRGDGKGKKVEKVDADDFMKLPGVKADDIDQKLYDASCDRDEPDYEPDDDDDY